MISSRFFCVLDTKKEGKKRTVFGVGLMSLKGGWEDSSQKT